MKIFSIQNKKLEKQFNGNVAYSSRDFICEKSFQDSYDWIISRANKYCTNQFSSNPFWGWVEKPDVEEWKVYFDPEEKESKEMILLELEVPDEICLESDFILWHHVLNKTYIPLNDSDYENFENKINDAAFAELGMQLQNEIISSWDRCLKIPQLGFTPLEGHENSVVQVIFPYIKKEYIKSVYYFTSFNTFKK